MPAKKAATKKKALTPARLREVLVQQRKVLSEKMRDIPEELLMEFGSAEIKQISVPSREGFFSDWPDTFSNNGTWYKTWGKGGGDIAAQRVVDQIQPSDMTAAITAVKNTLRRS